MEIWKNQLVAHLIQLQTERDALAHELEWTLQCDVTTFEEISNILERDKLIRERDFLELIRHAAYLEQELSKAHDTIRELSCQNIKLTSYFYQTLQEKRKRAAVHRLPEFQRVKQIRRVE
mmetsp:Transcript_19213/g.35131  ORF Transcript_19213/g.35131 Transcript_19213/m.35131 type:complete len:120 (+) Transcript_19213:3678-4037(+)